MDHQIIELLKSMSDSTQTVLIWYFILDYLGTLTGWISVYFIALQTGKGIMAVIKFLN